jgi:hypothetical protein
MKESTPYNGSRLQTTLISVQLILAVVVTHVPSLVYLL